MEDLAVFKMTPLLSDIGTAKAKRISVPTTLYQEERGFEIKPGLVFAFLLVFWSTFDVHSLHSLCAYCID